MAIVTAKKTFRNVLPQLWLYKAIVVPNPANFLERRPWTLVRDVDFSVTAAAPTSGKHVIGVEFLKTSMGQYHESHGPVKLYVDNRIVAEGRIRTMTRHFSLCGEGLCHRLRFGRRGKQRVQIERPFTGGTIAKVIFDVADDAYVDVERHMAAAMARD